MNTKRTSILLFPIAALAAVSISDASAGAVRVRCEKGANYSKASVDGRDLPPGLTYKARLISAGHVKTTALQAPVGDEAEFDFSSKADDIAAGATAIGAGFLGGTPPRATGKILDSSGYVHATDTVACRVK
ncbi:MAG: hypothetical protein ACU837_17315 [Gammaproteobacteria bacterium]